MNDAASASPAQGPAHLLPLPLPPHHLDRIVLVCIRRMAAHGIRDAHAAWLAFDTFGIHFRRPLVLLRAFLLELAEASHRSIKIAPCCAMRMTEDEGGIIEVLHLSATDCAAAEDVLAKLTNSPLVGEPLTAAAVLEKSLRAIPGRRAVWDALPSAGPTR